MRNFRTFVAHQVSRCEALPSGKDYMFSEAAQTEICNWLEFKSGENWKSERQSDLQWIQECSAARRVKAVIDQCMEGDLAPTVKAIREVWERLHGAKVAVNHNCQRCSGTGWELIITPRGEGSRRCPNGCPVPCDRVVAPERRNAVETAEYRRWAQDLTAEIAAKMKKAKRRKLEYLPPIPVPLTEADLERAKR